MDKRRIVLGETLPVDVLEVIEVGKGRYKTVLKDDEGDTSTLYLDVELPLGKAELKIFHTGVEPKSGHAEVARWPERQDTPRTSRRERRA